MSNSKSKTAFDKLKYEIAKETGVNLKEGYNGQRSRYDRRKHRS